jgi:hypothetical protein
VVRRQLGLLAHQQQPISDALNVRLPDVEQPLGALLVEALDELARRTR